MTGKRVLGYGFLLLGLATSPAAAQTEASMQLEVSAEDREAIIATALDYIEGYHEADGDRMARSVHADLAKRITNLSRDGVRKLDHMGKWTVVDITSRNRRAQKDADFSDRVRILDVYGGAASVRIDADTWVDFLQIAKIRDRWQIVNVLWELRPDSGGSP